MNSIYSKRKFSNFYLPLIIGGLFFYLLATIILIIYLKIGSDANNYIKPVFLLLMSIGCYAFETNILYKYLKNAPNVEFNDEMVIVNHKILLWSDIKEINLTGKHSIKGFIFLRLPMESLALTFNDGTTLIMLDDWYSNLWEIKSFIQDVIINKKTNYETEEIQYELNKDNNQSYTIYQRNPIITGLGILLLLMVVSILGLCIYFHEKILENVFFLSWIGFIILFCLFFYTFLMSYFSISESYLVICRQYFFWKKKKYFKIDDINEIVIESNRNYYLRIITKDFKSYLYGAYTLSTKQWKEIISQFDQLGISVRDECNLSKYH